MLFTSYKYALFVALAFCVYYLAARLARGRRLQNLVLLLLSYSFYALWDARWCLLLAAITATGFLGGLLLERNESSRKLIVVAVLLIDLGRWAHSSTTASSATPSPPWRAPWASTPIG